MAYDRNNPPHVDIGYTDGGVPELLFDAEEFTNEDGDLPIGARLYVIEPPHNAISSQYVSFGCCETRYDHPDDDDGDDEYLCDEYGVSESYIWRYEWGIEDVEWMRFRPEVRPQFLDCSDDTFGRKLAVDVQYVYYPEEAE